jgi:small subunit ribosomal protein S17
MDDEIMATPELAAPSVPEIAVVEAVETPAVEPSSVETPAPEIPAVETSSPTADTDAPVAAAEAAAPVEVAGSGQTAPESGAATGLKRHNKRQFVGIVTSDKMDKTAVVSVSTRKLHRLYKKYVNRSKKYKADDRRSPEERARVGDRVRIVECRPLSKEKCWRLAEIIARAR